MYGRILHRMRAQIRASAYIMTLHAVEEMEADGLTLFDVEHCFLTGQVSHRQKDAVTAEWKYLVHGSTLDGAAAVVVGKIGPTDKLVILTVYLA